MSPELVREKASLAAQFLVAAVVGNEKEEIEGVVVQTLTEFVQACERANLPAPPLGADYWRRVVFEHLAFAGFHAGVLALEREELEEEEARILFAEVLLDRLTEAAARLEGDLSRRISEYMKCKDPVGALRCWTYNAGMALSGSPGLRIYPIASLYCLCLAPQFPELVKIIFDVALSTANKGGPREPL